MECPHCFGPSRKFGTFQNSRGTTQRYRCSYCGKTFSKKLVNRISPEKEALATKLLRSGKSIRYVCGVVGIHSMTVIRLKQRLNIKRKTGARYKYQHRARLKYLKEYWNHQPMTQFQRWKWRERLRGYVATLLAWSPRPLFLKELHELVLPIYPECKLCALGYMLTRNCEGVFVKVGEAWTYRPSVLPPTLVASAECQGNGLRAGMWRARTIYHERFGLKDLFAEQIINGLVEAQKQFLLDNRVTAAMRAQKAFQMQATAAAIFKGGTK